MRHSPVSMRVVSARSYSLTTSSNIPVECCLSLPTPCAPSEFFQTEQTPSATFVRGLPTRGFTPHRDFTHDQRHILGLPRRASRRPQSFPDSRRFIPVTCLLAYCIQLPRPGFCCSGDCSSKAAVLSFERLCPLAVHSRYTNLLA